MVGLQMAEEASQERLSATSPVVDGQVLTVLCANFPSVSRKPSIAGGTKGSRARHGGTMPIVRKREDV